MSDLLPPGGEVDVVNGRERSNDPIKPCRSTAYLTLVVAGGIRLEILKSLVIASRDVTNLTNDLELDISMVSHNLRVLKDHGLVASRTLEQKRFYHLTDRVSGSPNGRFVHLEIGCVREETVVFKLLFDERYHCPR
ncbi:MAG: ArsR family transcriptional regulator [Phycisphaerales bacterium]